MSEQTHDDEQRPAAPTSAAELTEQDLETVAGGWSGGGDAARCSCGALEGGCSCSSGLAADW